jgi:hypothetical protein
VPNVLVARRTSWITVALAVAALVGAQSAAADTYCVHAAAGSCVAGAHDEGANLAKAMQDASNHAGADTISIGPGTFDGGAAGYSDGDTTGVTITGAGQGSTILTATGASTAVSLNAADISLSGVTVSLGTGTAIGLYVYKASVMGVTVSSTAPTANVVGADLSDATLTDSTISMPTDVTRGDEGVREEDGSASTVRSSSISGYDGLDTTTNGGPVLDASDVTVKAVRGVSADQSGTIDVNDGLIEISGGGEGVVAAGGTVTASSLTIVGDSEPFSTGVVSGGGGGENASLTLKDSIIVGFVTASERYVESGGGHADETLSYDDAHLNSDSGVAGTYSATHNMDADPQFVDAAAGDYHLLWSSPAIDAGGSCPADCTGTPDLDGLARPIDGNGDGTAVRDMGAYEYGHRAPVARVAAPESAHAGDSVTFDASPSSDPDDGDTLTYAWRFDDGATASGAKVTHAFAAAGNHTATVTVTDPTHLTSSATATVVIAAPRDRTPPTVSALKLAPATFRIGAGRTAAVASKRSHGHHHKGTTIEFKLSEPGAVVASFERRTRGVRSGKACVARRPRLHHGHACTRWVKDGSLRRHSEDAGHDTIAFSGRIGRKALALGAYRMTLVATDRAGNRSAAKTAGFTVVAF